ncbi:hypothetical protein FB566_0360 [Stackebrandtia endophytica]|uniref:Uncharacterized protein n=1 Tax=Stackebrandtia endophytica TaxID=1496996 RepID=A0A543AQK0_9ACTN|nr:hypothetical protein [Stackebrandtia endophytica]TQL74871.1 hypothetical protein FB566_0360 [Stackebrandtia endophytica]
MTANPGTVRNGLVHLLRGHGTTTVTFWGIVIGLALVAEPIVITAADDPNSVWQGFRWAPQYFMLFLGVMLVTTHLPVQVAHGLTRSAALRAGTIVAAVLSAGSAILLQLGFVVERAVYNSLGLVQFADGIDLVESPGRIIVSTVEFFGLYLAYFFGGWAIAAGYYRLGGWYGTLLIIPAAVPAAVAEYSHWNGGLLVGATGQAQAWLAVAAVIALVGLLWTYVRALTRTVPIRAK